MALLPAQLPPVPRDGVPPARAALVRVQQDEAVAAIDSAGLLQGRKTLVIRHRGETYRLQETRQGKLILTK